MSDYTPTRTAADVLRDLHRFVREPQMVIDALSEREIRDELKRRTINSAVSFKAMQELMDQEVAAAELAVARSNRLKRLQSIPQSGPLGINLRDKVLSLIRSLSPMDAAGYFNKFQSSKDEDLQSLYDDLTALNEKADDAQDG